MNFFNENVEISLTSLPKFDAMGPINNKPALVHINLAVEKTTAITWTSDGLAKWMHHSASMP